MISSSSRCTPIMTRKQVLMCGSPSTIPSTTRPKEINPKITLARYLPIPSCSALMVLLYTILLSPPIKYHPLTTSNIFYHSHNHTQTPRYQLTPQLEIWSTRVTDLSRDNWFPPRRHINYSDMTTPHLIPAVQLPNFPPSSSSSLGSH